MKCAHARERTPGRGNRRGLLLERDEKCPNTDDRTAAAGDPPMVFIHDSHVFSVLFGPTTGAYIIQHVYRNLFRVHARPTKELRQQPKWRK